MIVFSSTTLILKKYELIINIINLFGFLKRKTKNLKKKHNHLNLYIKYCEYLIYAASGFNIL